MISYFYDIESLENVFTLANFRTDANEVDIFYLLDDKDMLEDSFKEDATQRIYDKNKNFNGKVNFFDLEEEESNKLLAKTFGLSDARYANDPDKKNSYGDEFRLVCDTDTNYDENVHPFLFGYNSYNYDTTMLAMYFYDVFPIVNKKAIFEKTTANIMRVYNNELFSPRFKKNMYERLRYDYADNTKKEFGKSNFTDPKAVIRKNMLMSGRHLDVARLNEKQSKVALKRLLGMLGYQILESDKLRPGQDRIESYDQLLDLIAYNISDVVNLAKLNDDKVYQASFMIKRQMLKDYPELIYEKKADEYAPDISPKTVRNDRLTIDSSSAQMATKALCPYGHLEDYDVVDFTYPSEAKSKEYGIPQVNVLEESRKFFYDNFGQYPDICEKFDAIYDYYKSIEGKNFNNSKNYLEDHGIFEDQVVGDPFDQLAEDLKPQDLGLIQPPNTCLFYYNADGTPSNCFVNFSTGGIHGAEYNRKLYEADLKAYEEDMKKWQDKVDLIDRVKAMYPNPWDIKVNKGVEIDGVKYKPSDFLQPKPTETTAAYKDYPKQPKKPELFVGNKSPKTGIISYKLAGKYTFTSAAKSQHEDFTSYYPNMLRMMSAFWNEGLGYDRYGKIFDQKTEFGHKMKDKSFSQDERDLYSIMREGTKLVLNSASGAGDAGFESNVRMNNKIISMRIIGQLFTWRIGQAQTLKGASIISTNTDGLYSAGLEAELNNKILADEAKNIHVEIEPEPIYLISKDSNNRAEIEFEGNELGKIAGASGGTLSCRKGPNVKQNLAHPAIIDWALTEYLIVASANYKNLALDKPFDNEIGMNILKSASSEFTDKVHLLRMFQNIVASSPSSDRYVFATPFNDPDTTIPLQHYNRCFIVKDNTPGTYNLHIAAATVITEATAKKRKKLNERDRQHNPVALNILSVNGVTSESMGFNKEATIVKVTGLEDNWCVYVKNNDLHLMTDEEIDEILDKIDYDKYLTMLKDSYESNWMNNVPIEEKEEEIVVPKLFEDTDNDSAETEVAADDASDVTETNDTDTDSNTDTDNNVFQKATDFVLNENTKLDANVSEDYQFTDDDNPITAIDSIAGDVISYKNAYIEHLKNRTESYDDKTKAIMLKMIDIISSTCVHENNLIDTVNNCRDIMSII